jgi:hypothetical protein
LQEVSDTLRDNDKCADIIARAYADIVATGKYSYKSFVKKFDDIINANIDSNFVRETGLIDLQEYYSINNIEIVKNPYAVQQNVFLKFLQIIKYFIKCGVKFLKKLLR